MRLVGIIFLILAMQACGVSPKDYSGAKKLETIENRLSIKPLWIEPSGDVPEYAHAQLPPVMVGENLYVASIKGKVSRINAKTGRSSWSRSLGEMITGGPGTGQGMIFVGTRNAEIIGLDQTDGSERWRSKISSEMLSLPVFNNGSLIVQTIDGKISSIDGSTGKLNWVYTHSTPKLTLRGTSSPLAIGNNIIGGFADGKLVSINAVTGELNWSTTISAPTGRTDLERLADIDGVMKSTNDTVYVISYQGRVAAVSLMDGNIQWSRKMSSYTGLSIGNGNIYVSDVEGHVWALDARTGATLWKQSDLTGREISTPEVIGNAVVVADFDGFVHWLSLEDGRFLARQSLSDLWEESYPTVYERLDEELDAQEYHRLVTVAPIAAGNLLFVRDNFGALAALQVEK